MSKDPKLAARLRFIAGARKLAEDEKLEPEELINILMNTAAAAAYLTGYTAESFSKQAATLFAQVDKEVKKGPLS